MVAAALLVALVRPRLFTRSSLTLDLALGASLAVAILQLVPLPAEVRMSLSPGLAAIDRALRLDAASGAGAAPLSVDPGRGGSAVLLGAAVILVFWSARAVYAAGGVRRAVRALAACGLTVSASALIQHVARPHLLYGIWHPQHRNAEYPFGPFVNRNDLAAWLIMALPLAIGYFAARLDLRRRERRLTLDSVFDGTGEWVAVAIALMAATLASTLSRSGLMGGMTAAVAFLLLTRRRVERRARAGLVAGMALVALVAAAYVNLGALTTRVGETIQSGVAGRREIWQTTAAIIRDFRLTGVGVGAFETAMIVYQPPHQFAFNHAHDEYLQIAAEGGLLLVTPVVLAVAAGIWGIGRRLACDQTPTFWIRAGAAAGLAAIAVQSVWETGLRMPANAVLFALCAAIAMHGGDGGNGGNGNRADGGNGKA